MESSYHKLAWRIKRAMDLAVAGVGLVVLSPIIVLMAVIVRIETRGPAIYKHTRIGKDGKPFDLYKIRSMQTGGDDTAYELYLRQLIESSQGSNVGMPYIKMEGDSRVTRVGGFLRKYYLDELPQLWNIVKGDMSLIGPRPHMQLEVDHYKPTQLQRLIVRPGLTGLWQVDGKADCSFAELIALDLEYINHWSPRLDYTIMIKTLGLMIRGGEGSWSRTTKRIPGLNWARFGIQQTESTNRRKAHKKATFLRKIIHKRSR